MHYSVKHTNKVQVAVVLTVRQQTIRARFFHGMHTAPNAQFIPDIAQVLLHRMLGYAQAVSDSGRILASGVEIKHAHLFARKKVFLIQIKLFSQKLKLLFVK